MSTLKKYVIKLSNTVRRMITIYFIMGLWKTTGNGIVSISQLFYFLSFSTFGLSVMLEAYLTDDNDETVFLVTTSLIGIVQIGRLYNIIWKQNQILELLRENGPSTNNYNSFCAVDNKLNKLMSLATYFITTTFFLFVVVAGFPFVKKELIFDIAFPLDYKRNSGAFYVAYVFVAGVFFVSITCILFTSMLWYIMLNFVGKYEILGNDLKNLGVFRTLEENHTVSQLYQQDLIDSIKNLENLNTLLKEFASNFSNLFLLQIVTSSICICGGIYTLAFSSHVNLVQDGFYFIVIFYCFFDTFTLLYLGNEIKVASDKLSYCLFESDWIEQTQSCKMCILIVVERLKQPQQLVVGKLFPMNLRTFTMIVNRAYSMFNILTNLRQ